jgi:hypothetical protein
MSVEAKVAEVLGRHELVINAGAEVGVRKDDVVFLLKTRLIKDPDSGEALGHVRRSVARFKVIEVQERLCVARSIDTVGDPIASLFAVRASPFSGPALKGVTTNPAEVDERTLLTSVGEPVVIQRPKPNAAESGQARRAG